MARRLRIHADPAYLPEGERHVEMLYPFWGVPAEAAPVAGATERYVATAREHLELTSLQDADVAIFPQDYKTALARTPDTIDGRAHAFAAEARAAGKPFVIFRAGDSTDPVPVAGAIVVRQSLLRSRRRPLEHAMPAFHEDLLAYTGGELRLRPWSPTPVVGFCGTVVRPEAPRGLAAGTRRRVAGVRRRALERLRRPSPDDVYARARAVDALEAQHEVGTNVVVRAEWGGGAFFPAFDAAQWATVRKEFVDNLAGSDYGLCVRGIGNFSYRLYETLCLGRIPVVVDTDVVLPYESLIDWRAHAVWVDRTEIPRIGERVAAFHAALGPDGFVELQRSCRRIWEELLTAEGFFAHFHLLVGATGSSR